MSNFPKKSLMDRRITKEKLVSSIKATPAEEKLLTDEVQRIIWKYCFSEATLNIAEGERIKEFHFFQLGLKKYGVSDALLKYLSRSPKPLIFILKYEDEWSFAVIIHGRVYKSSWVTEEPELEIKGLTLDEVYDNFLSFISGINFDGIDFNLAAENAAIQEKLQKKLTLLEKKARGETQPKEQMRLLGEIELLRKQRSPIPLN